MRHRDEPAPPASVADVRGSCPDAGEGAPARPEGRTSPGASRPGSAGSSPAARRPTCWRTGRRSAAAGRGLGGVADLDRAAPAASGGVCRSSASRSQRLTAPVEHAARPAPMRLDHRRQQPVEAAAGLGGQRHQRRAAGIGELVLAARRATRASAACGSSIRSHLLSTRTMARPSARISRAMVRSWRSNAWVASMTRATASARRSASMVEAVESFSSRASIRALRRRPAVSTSSIRRPCQVQAIFTLSRVSPGSGPVSIRSCAISRLTSELLPTFGRPTMASRSGRGLVVLRSGSGSGASSIGAGRRAGRRGRALARRDRDRLAEAQRPGLLRLRRARRPPSVLLADQDDRLVLPRSRSATSRRAA